MATTLTTGDLLLSIGIPASIKGYDFICTAVRKARECPTLLEEICKGLYPTVAREHNTTASKVQRAICYAIAVAHKKDGFLRLNRMLGMEIYSFMDCPTNGEFIALLVKRCVGFGRAS